MGFYINPKNGQTKGDWLQDNALEHTYSAPQTFRKSIDGTDCILVCLIDNIWMTAAGVIYDIGELNSFSIPDGRLKTWYFVPVSLVLKVCPEVQGYL